MKVRLQRGVILNDQDGRPLGNGNNLDARDIEVDDNLGQQLLKGGSADLLEPSMERARG